MHSRTIVSVLVMIAGLAGPVSAGAACLGHEKVSAIIRAWEALEPVRGLRTDLSMEEAECGRKRLVQKLELALGRTVGYKAGLTNPAVQKRFGVTAPLRGMLLQRMLLEEGNEVPARFGARPVFEADLLVVVKDSGIHRARTRLEALNPSRSSSPSLSCPTWSWPKARSSPLRCRPGRASLSPCVTKACPEIRRYPCGSGSDKNE